MAYEDPTHLRDNPIKVRLNDDEYDLIKALSVYAKKQPAVLARELLLAGVEALANRTEEAHAA